MASARWSAVTAAGLALACGACAAVTTTAPAARRAPATSAPPATPSTSTTVPASTVGSEPSTTRPALSTTTTGPTTTVPSSTTATSAATTSSSTTSTTSTVPSEPANGLAGVVHVGGIPSTQLIHPTAVILHWWGAVTNSDISALVDSLNSEVGYYEPWLTKAQYLSNQANGVDGHHLGVQFAVTQDGKMWELTPYANSWAAHAACGNGWAVGIEIEGRDAADLHGDQVQFQSVVRLVGELLTMFHIPLDGSVAANGLSGSGVLSHKEVDAHCYFADGSFAGEGKIDVDDAYLAEVKAALAKEGFR